MNREQFTFLVRKELPGLRRFLLAACSGNGQEADDIAQEALLKAYTASVGFEDEGGFSRWLYRIACNCLADHQRKDSVRAGTLSIEKAYSISSASHSDDTFDYQELYRAIDGLTLSERTAVLLFYMEDRPVKEIATIMNTSEGTVKASLSRGRSHLREKLKG
ncbi:MAG: sigma-70 family RNA polymerase sigma factor [Bacteroidaceae bacterium]|nr:sigma-70 family RNA polymerase sigma factor [Bacteroidaceae bacterium]